ncbi:MAG: hypothetical protein WCI72_05430 [archaeon]
MASKPRLKSIFAIDKRTTSERELAKLSPQAFAFFMARLPSSYPSTIYDLTISDHPHDQSGDRFSVDSMCTYDLNEARDYYNNSARRMTGGSQFARCDSLTYIVDLNSHSHRWRVIVKGGRPDDQTKHYEYIKSLTNSL